MALMETATSLVHVVGIVMLTYGLSPDQHLQAIAPRIDPDSKLTTAEIKQTQVEQHKAILFFPQSAVKDGTTWKWGKLERLPEHGYVELDGEQVTMVTGLENPNAPVELQLTTPAVTGLPKLKNCCPEATLKVEFQPPAFRGAAGVLNFPPGNGIVETCGARIGDENGTSLHRIDTLVRVANNGVITLRGTGGRELRLDGNAEIYLANVPSIVLTGTEGHAHGGPAHYIVYYAMIDHDGCADYMQCHGSSSNPCGALLRQIRKERNDRAAQSKGGAQQKQARRGRSTGAKVVAAAPIDSPQAFQPIDQVIAELVDYQCSNSQWP